MTSLKNKTIFISGEAEGLALKLQNVLREMVQILQLLRRLQNRIQLLPGTIYTAADEIVEAGGKALPLYVIFVSRSR